MSQLIGGRYRLDRELAAGGFGTVWQAFDTVLRVEVAVKQVKIDPTATGAERAKAVARAEHEARNAARLRDHPNIVAIHDVVTEQGAPWLVMQLVAGRSLHQELAARGRLSPDEAGSIARAVLAALAAAHEAGIVHRDVKPANIMLAGDGTVLLTDFGIAKHHADTAQTTRGMLIGSLPYMSPERLDGQNLPAGDLFALGVTLYEMTEGVSPFGRDSFTAIMAAVVLQAPEAPKHAGHLTSLVLALLEKEHTRRPSARQALALLGRTGSAPAAPPPMATGGVATTVAATAPATVAAVLSDGAAPVPETVAATAAGEANAGRRRGRELTNELIRLAAGEGDRAEEVQRVLWAMSGRLAADDPRLAERLVNAITETSWQNHARIELAEALWQSDPVQARRLVAAVKDFDFKLDQTEAALRLWPIDLRTAERLIGTADIPDVWKSEELGNLAAAVAAVDVPNAERIARAVALDHVRPRALAGVAAAIVATQPARARELVEEAVNAAAALDEGPERAEAFAGVAGNVALFDPHRAEQIARSIALPVTRREKRRARQAAGTAVSLSFAAAMAQVASAMAVVDAQRARQLAEEAQSAEDASLLPDPALLSTDEVIAKVRRLGHLAVALAATDPRRAVALTEDAVRVIEGSLFGGMVARMELAVTVAGALPDITERLAADLTGQHLRDEIVAKLTGTHPDLAARITAMTPNAASVLSAAARDPHRAAELARAIADDGERVAALLPLAELVADRAPDMVEQLCDDCEGGVLYGPGGETVVDLLVTAARAATDPHRAQNLPGELARIATAVPAGAARNAAVGAAAGLMAGFDPQRAEALARKIDDDDEWGLWALGLIACCLLSRTDPLTWKPATSMVTFAEYVLFIRRD